MTTEQIMLTAGSIGLGPHGWPGYYNEDFVQYLQAEGFTYTGKKKLYEFDVGLAKIIVNAFESLMPSATEENLDRIPPRFFVDPGAVKRTFNVRGYIKGESIADVEEKARSLDYFYLYKNYREDEVRLYIGDFAQQKVFTDNIYTESFYIVGKVVDLKLDWNSITPTKMNFEFSFVQGKDLIKTGP